ncbi:MAG: hypothetical protein RBU25_18670 [Lentisphaeria bacterium]|jgi:hypothetical protein|nr:hypothetical protein [Lentisphaeria bacterium]
MNQPSKPPPGDGYLKVPALDGKFDLDRVMEFDEGRKRWCGKGQKWRVELEKTFGCEINDVYGGTFFSDNDTGYLYFFGHYEWNGASGPTLDDPSLRLSSAIHDAICTKGPKGRRVVKSYWKRHEIYRRVMLAHCPYTSRIGKAYHVFRAWKHWLGLVACNWAWDLLKRAGQ